MKANKLIFSAVLIILLSTIPAHAKMPKQAKKELKNQLENKVIRVNKEGFRAAGANRAFSSLQIWWLGGTSYVYSMDEHKKDKAFEFVDEHMYMVDAPPNGVVSVDLGDPYKLRDLIIQQRSKDEIVLVLQSTKRYEFINAFGGQQFDSRIIAFEFHFPEIILEEGNVESILTTLGNYLDILD